MRPIARSVISLLVLVAACSKSGSTGPTTGSLQITITGLGATPAFVTIAGPAGYNHGIASTTTLIDLTPGSYTIQATPVTANNATYAGTPASQSVTVAASTTAATALVAYNVSTGALALTVSGLPGGTNASVSITGPSSYHHASTATETITGLTPGSYHVAAASVSGTSNFYDPSPVNQDIVVAASATPTPATVTYGISTGLNLWIDGLNITQATQTYTNTIPLVKDRDGYLRVFVRANQTNTATPKVRVRWYSGATLIRTDTILSSNSGVLTAIDTGTLANSWNLHVPGSLIQPGLAILADVDPQNLVAEGNEGDNSFPVSGTAAALAVHAENPFNVTLVPVRTKFDGLTGNVSAGNAESFMGFLQRIHPVPSHSATVHAIYTTTDSTHALQSNDANGMWETVITEMQALRAVENPAASQYYYGVVGPAYTSGVAGLGYISFPVAIGWDGAIKDQILAHEVGHNWGRQHSPGCNAGNPDPTYPNLSGHLDNYGLDLAGDTLFPPAVYYDIMSYCHPEWVSTFTYSGVMAFRESHPDIVSAAAAAGASEPVLLVWGRMRDGEMVLEPAFEIVARAQRPEGSGAYTIQGLDDKGTALFSYAFAGTEIADAPIAARSFAFTIPLSQFDVTRLSSLRLAGNGREVRRAGGAAVAAMRVGGARSGGVSASALGGRGVRLTWDATSYPMALVRDAATGEVLSFARGGSVEVPTTGALEILLSDGVRSLHAQQ